MSNIFVQSETTLLQKVIIHSPDIGISSITPDKALELLYEDIVHYDLMLSEHRVLQKVLEKFLGKENVIEIQTLLSDILENPSLRELLIRSILNQERDDEEVERQLKNLDKHSLAITLITGINTQTNQLLFSPLPNFIFTRDIGAVINDHILVSKFSKKARYREALISAFIFRHHPIFGNINTENRLIEIPDADTQLSIESGDVMMLSPQHLLLANSERTSMRAVEYVQKIVLEKGIVEKVTVVELPKTRYCMHFDTIFTFVSDIDCVVYEPLLLKDNAVRIKTSSKEKEVYYPTIKAMLHAEINQEIEFTSCGGGVYPYDQREQWTDGCNLVAIKNGVAIGYDRNKKTLEAFEKKGYRIIQGDKLLEMTDVSTLQNAIITIPSSELSRARGGPHCLTMPIKRA